MAPRSPLSLPDFEPVAELSSEDSWEVMVLWHNDLGEQEIPQSNLTTAQSHLKMSSKNAVLWQQSSSLHILISALV